MNNIIIFKERYPNNKILWKKEWISDFESVWSIFEKFRYMNSLTNLDFTRVFGSEYAINVRSKNVNSNPSIYDLRNYNDDILIKLFNIDVNKFNQDNIFRLIKKQHYDYKYFRRYLLICPICIQKGFHSIFNQFRFIHDCPFHKVPLISNCPRCLKKRKYEYQLYGDLTPFQCKCGNNYLNSDSIRTSWETVSINSIKSEPLLRLLSIDDICINDYIFSDINYNYKNEIKEENLFKHNIEELLGIENSLPKLLNKSNIFLHIKGSINHKTLQQLHFQRKKLLGRRIYYKYFELHDSKFDSTEQEVVEDYLENVADKLYSSIARRIRKIILKEHKYCLNIFVNNIDQLTLDNICPLTYAYLLWRKESQNFDSISDVLNRSRPRKFRALEGFFPLINDYNFILEKILNEWRYKYLTPFKEFHLEEWENISWTISKVLEVLYLSDFKKCFNVVCEAISKRQPIEEWKFDLDIPTISPSFMIPNSLDNCNYVKICFKGKPFSINGYKYLNCPN